MDAPEKIEIVGTFLAIRWQDGEELFLDASTLRANSPSAEHAGEVDIFGKISGGNKFQPEICKIYPVEGYQIANTSEISNPDMSVLAVRYSVALNLPNNWVGLEF